jgi:hypothetical protein
MCRCNQETTWTLCNASGNIGVSLGSSDENCAQEPQAKYNKTSERGKAEPVTHSRRHIGSNITGVRESTESELNSCNHIKYIAFCSLNFKSV